jgi:pepF/M3 family oligoendopeptidase
MQHPLPQTWDLDIFFAGGSGSPSFAAFLEQIGADLATFRDLLTGQNAPRSINETTTMEPLVALMQCLLLKLREADSFVGCLMAADQSDKKAIQLNGRIKSLSAAFSASLTRFDELLTSIPDDVWSEALEGDLFRAVAFPLKERRQLAKEKMAPALEALAGDLAVDGYHGWGSLYDTTVGQIRVPVEENGEIRQLSVGQASNKLHSADRGVRQAVFASWEESWAKHADFCADALNHLAGFRLEMYRNRGWNEVLKEPLAINRMTKKTLDAMWEAIVRNKPVFVEYLKRKAELLGLPALAWYDVEAPIGKSESTISYDDSAETIVKQFHAFSPEMGTFAQGALENGWIEAEDRPGKRPGGFCTSFPIKKQTRIFMTYSGTMNNLSTLAHELGHAYHQYVMNDVPALAQEYAMNVAETASTFAEMLVGDAAVRQASTEEERITLLEDKIQRSVAFFMNIHGRFLFETRFYEERKQGLVSVERLNELMEEAQHEAFGGALSSYHPYFWASKLHFYITEVPFYNFPYTFGYLFSSGIYAISQREGSSFAEKYAALLRDTGSMTVEELARRHLNVELEEMDFWQAAVDMAAADVKQFLELTASR